MIKLLTVLTVLARGVWLSAILATRCRCCMLVNDKNHLSLFEQGNRF